MSSVSVSTQLLSVPLFEMKRYGTERLRSRVNGVLTAIGNSQWASHMPSYVHNTHERCALERIYWLFIIFVIMLKKQDRLFPYHFKHGYRCKRGGGGGREGPSQSQKRGIFFEYPKPDIYHICGQRQST